LHYKDAPLSSREQRQKTPFVEKINPLYLDQISDFKNKSIENQLFKSVSKTHHC
jgi:hypothetical protein